MPSLRRELPGIHGLSGCDSTSCFNGVGKVRFLNADKSDQRFIDAAALFGEEENLCQLVKHLLEELVCRLYRVPTEDVDDARYKVFIKGKSTPDPRKLPPTRDALHLHFDRANYQCHEWKSALDKDHLLLNPVGYGWKEDDGKLAVNWTLFKPAPDSILEFVSCECKKSQCVNNQCKCKSVNLSCTDLCL